MNRNQKRWIEQQLIRFPFINWDRFIELEYEDDSKVIRVFGWIKRNDTYKDFVVIDLLLGSKETDLVITSSAEWSEQLFKEIHGNETPHNSCKRVEHLVDINNSIKLKK